MSVDLRDITNKQHVFENGVYKAVEYVFQPFPKVKYHATKPPVTVADVSEEKALGAGWHDAPVEKKAEPKV